MRRALAVVLVLGSLAGERAASATLWPSAEGRVERALADADVVVRRQAALELATLPRSAARRLAAPALADADVEVRLAALAVAVRLGEDDLGGRLAAWLSDPDTRLRLAAAEALTTRVSARALSALGRASSDTDPRVRAAVARALGASASSEAVLPLLGRLDDAVPDVRREVVTALAELGDRRAVVPLLGKVQDPSGAVRRAAARALGRLGDARAGSALVLVLRDSDPEVRTAALEAVGRLRDVNAVWSVVAALADGDTNVRTAAAVALARLATPAALAALLAELDRDADPEPIVGALVLAGPAALPLLRGCVETTAARGRVEGCARALGALGDASDVARLRGALASGTVPPLVALPVLASLGGPAAVPAVLEFLASPDAAVRHAAAFALAELIDPAHPDGRAVDPLLQAFRARSGTAVERALVVRLLGRTGEARVGAELARVARETTAPSLAASALLALGDLGAGPWEPTLLAQLDAEDGSVRMAAALALRRSASASAFGAVLERLERGAEQDRLALGIALPGAARASRDARQSQRLVVALAKAGDDERDALLEAWAELEAPAAFPASELDVADRRKLAEVLAGRATQHARLVELARDTDARVRANAAWSLGHALTPSAFDALTPLLADRDPRVAANAAVSVGRLGRRLRRDVAPLLCPLTNDARSSVRADAAAGLGVAGLGCPGGVLERLLAVDASPRVRRAAARALGRAARTQALDAALERCATEDANADVAAECRPRAKSTSSGELALPVLVFVVPTGAAVPSAGAPFALRLADGTERFGVADRRGAVFEPHAPAGTVELGVLPAAGE